MIVSELSLNQKNIPSRLSALKSFSIYSRELYNRYANKILEFIKSVLLRNQVDCDQDNSDWIPYCNLNDISKSKVLNAYCRSFLLNYW